MPVAVPSTPGDDAGGPPEADLAARVAAGPGLREDEDWLAGLRRESLPESLLADGTITAGAAAEHAHKQERALNAEATALCLVTGALFPLLGYDAVLAWSPACPASRPGPAPRCRPALPTPRRGNGPGRLRPGPCSGPTRPAATFPQARTGPYSAWRSPGSTAPPWNCSMTRCSPRSPGFPRPARNRCCASSGCCTPAPAGGRPPSSAVTWTGRTPWQTSWNPLSARGQLNLADRGFFSMDRFIRFSSAGAHLLWRAKNAAKS